MSWDPKVRQPEDEAHTRSDSRLCISCVDRESISWMPSDPSVKRRSVFRDFARQPPSAAVARPLSLRTAIVAPPPALTRGNSINPIGDFNPYIGSAMALPNRMC